MALPTLEDFKKDMRVELHPACDLWMQGARFGTVVSVGPRFVNVRLDLTNRIHFVKPYNLRKVEV